MNDRRTPLAWFVLALACLCHCFAVPARAGAWTQPRGKLYTRASANYYLARREFDGNGARQRFFAHGEFADLNVGDYLEYGLTDKVTVIGSASLKRLRDENNIRVITSWGFGDIDLAARGRLANGPSGVVAAQLLAKIPEAYDANADLPLGNGQYDCEARLLYGCSLWKLFPGYAGLEGGYRWRAKAPSDEIRYLVEIGSNLGAGVYGRAKLDGIRSRKNGRKTDAGGNPTAQNSFDLGKLDLTLGRPLGSGISLEAGFTPAIFGRTTAAGSTFTLAASYVNRRDGK